MTLILCAGEQKRFSAGTAIKQFLRFDGEKLLDRILRQIRLPALIVSHRKAFDGFGVERLNPEQNTTTCHTIRSTKHLWRGQTVILLGDVRYTKEAIKTIYSFKGAFQLFTDTGDYFAMSFDETYHDTLLKDLNGAINNYTQQGHLNCGILHLHRHMGLPQDICTIIADETQDFDRPYEYEDFLKGFSKNRLYGKKSERYIG